MVVAASAAPAEEVGKVGVDWLGNDICHRCGAGPKSAGCDLSSGIVFHVA
jgi:CreA protein